MPQLLSLAAEVRQREARRAQEREDAERDFRRELHRVMWQCVALSFAGVPLFGWSIWLADDRQARVALAAAFFVSYALPYFRWLAFHLSSSNRDQ